MKRISSAGWIAIVCLFSACHQKTTSPTPSAPAQQERTVFYGRIEISSSVESADSVLRASLRSFSPEKVDIWFGENKFRMIEYGGLSHGNILVFTDMKESWQIDTAKHLAYLGDYSDLGDPSTALKNTMPDHFAPTVEITEEKETICGEPCTKYAVVRSGFIPTDDRAFIWVADRIKFPSSRFDVQTEVNRTAVPPPLLIGYEEGAVMRLMVRSRNYSRTYEVTKLEKNNLPEDIFNIPEGYMKK